MRPQRSDAITPTKQSTTKSCASFMRYTVSSVWGIGDKLPIILLPVNIDTSSLFGQKHGHIYLYDGIVQDCGNSSVIALEILQFCGKPYICPYWIIRCFVVLFNGTNVLFEIWQLGMSLWWPFAALFLSQVTKTHLKIGHCPVFRLISQTGLQGKVPR